MGEKNVTIFFLSLVTNAQFDRILQIGNALIDRMGKHELVVNILKVLIEVAGQQLRETYGKQYRDFLMKIKNEFLPDFNNFLNS